MQTVLVEENLKPFVSAQSYNLLGSGAKPQPTNDLVHISEPKGAALVARVFVHFHNNKFKFLYKHKTA